MTDKVLMGLENVTCDVDDCHNISTHYMVQTFKLEILEDKEYLPVIVTAPVLLCFKHKKDHFQPLPFIDFKEGKYPYAKCCRCGKRWVPKTFIDEGKDFGDLTMCCKFCRNPYWKVPL